MKKFGGIFILLAIYILVVFRNWFLVTPIIGGDWPFTYQETVNTMPLFVPSWLTWQGNGLGGTNPAYFIQTYQFFTFFVSHFLHIPWNTTVLFFWFGLFLFVACISSIILIQTIYREFYISNILSPIIYLTNTYILLVVSGGQMGVALSYALAPLVVALFIKLFARVTIVTMLTAALAFAVQMALDPRIAYCTLLIVGMLCLWSMVRMTAIHQRVHVLVAGVGVALIVLLINMFWLLPLIVLRQNPMQELGAAYDTATAVKFFSFARFPQAFSLLHPNWPENIFGKVYFMKPEFLILPLLAYGFFSIPKRWTEKIHTSVQKGKTIIPLNESVLVFALVGMIGAFLAKGANEPFGEIYIWLFQHIPGFVMFRDPVKWYLVVAIAYSVLIPISIQHLASISRKKYVYTLFCVLFLAFWSFTIKDALFSKLNGTFAQHIIPQEYVKLKEMLVKDESFSRVLWIPRHSRFAYTSFQHPSIEAEFLLSATNAAELKKVFSDKRTEQKLKQLAVRYVVLPIDSMGEIFVTDRTYDDKKRRNMGEILSTVPWLEKKSIGSLDVYEISSPNDHFSLLHKGSVSHNLISTDEYELNVETENTNTLIFAENYSQYWMAKTSTAMIGSHKYKNDINSFNLPEGSYKIIVYNKMKDYYFYGRVISIIAFCAIVLMLLSIGTYKTYTLASLIKKNEKK